MAGDSAGFESYLRGSWWGVHIHMERSSMFLVGYNADRDEEKAWVPFAELRLSSRRSDVWDCYFLRKGMDVAVLAKHPHSNDLNLKKEGLYDARVSSITKKHHLPGECTCTVNVHFLSLIMDTYVDGSLLDRVLLTDEPETQVSISDIRILRKPSEFIPFEDILEAHQAGGYIAVHKGCQDAMFLTETDLSTAKRRHGADDQSNAISSPSENQKDKQSGGYVDGASPQSERDADGARPQSGRYANGAGRQAGECADGANLRVFSPKRKWVPIEDRDDGQPNDRVEEVPPPKRKRGRPRLHNDKAKYPKKEEKAQECLRPRLDKYLRNRHKERLDKNLPPPKRKRGRPRLHNDKAKYPKKEEKAQECLRPRLDKYLRNRHKEKLDKNLPPPKRKRGRPRLHNDKAKYPKEEEKAEECLRPTLDKNLQNRHKQRLHKNLRGRHKEKTTNNTKQRNVDLEWTESVNVLSSDESDSEGEWKPSGLKNFPRTPYNIRNRGEKTPPH